MDLVELSKTDNSVWVKFFNEIIEIEEPLSLNIEKVDIIVEPDFGKKGFGSPDAVISMNVQGANDRKIFFIEAKRDTFRNASEDKAKRSEKGFNSSLNGQLELKYRFTRALKNWNAPATAIEEDPGWILKTEYDKDQKTLQNPHVLTDVISKYGLKTTIENYYYIVLTTDTTNPLEKLDQNIQPEFFDNTGNDCWNDLRQKQFGWFNFDKIKKLIEDFKYTEQSLFLASYKLNESNMKIANKDDDNMGFTSGVTMIYAPDIKKDTYLHFSWKGNSCVLRDYSQTPPLDDNDKTTSFVRKKIVIERYIPNRKAITEFEFWQEKTKKLNEILKNEIL
jgi:hypothetical protein